MKKDTIRRILLMMAPYRLWIFLTVLFSSISVGTQLIIPIFCGKAIDSMLSKNNVNFTAIFRILILIGVFSIFGAVVQRYSSHINNLITFSLSRDLRNNLSSKINKLPIAYLDRHPVGDTVSRMVADVDSFSDGLLMGFTQLFSGVITIIATLCIMLYLNWVITLFVFLLTPLSIFTAKFIASKTARLFRQQSYVRGEQTAFINEIVEGQRVVKEFGHENEAIKDFDIINNKLNKISLYATFFSSLTNPSTRLINNMVYAVVTLISSIFAIAGKISVGGLSIFLSYASQYAKPFNEISGVITELQNAFTCADRIFELLDQKNETEDCPTPKDPKPDGKVDIDNISFGYTPDKILISNFSLNVKKGQRIAIVGPTGCGKTTLINLLMRFYDVNSGTISVDGVNINEITRQNLRTRYGMVLQDTWLSTGTVRDNIAYSNPSASDEEIIAAAKNAYAHSFIMRLPDGYNTKIIENGANLSAGQKQLLCIARAMLSLPNMLILDEATSSIDTRTEIKIQSAFSKMMHGRTSFIVAHRLSTIREADVILVMKDGQIIEKGNHTELLELNGFYAKLYNSQ